MRIDGRKADELRKVKISRNYIKSAEGSVLIEMGWKSAYRDDRAEVLLPPDSPAMNASISE